MRFANNDEVPKSPTGRFAAYVVAALVGFGLTAFVIHFIKFLFAL